ncbi:MAG: hypothetical protein KDD55_03225 [Bdellovibrionales bacterium]|nr:hypothetical protein [Bdellovibrionales bacterium]
MTGATLEVESCSLEEASQVLGIPPERVLELAAEGAISTDPRQETPAYSRRDLRLLIDASFDHPEILLESPCSFEGAAKQLYLEEDELKRLVGEGEIRCYRVSLEHSPHGRVFEQADVDRLAREFAGEYETPRALALEATEEDPYAALSMPRPVKGPSLIESPSEREEDDSKVVA